MSQRQRALEALNDELRTIQVFDRVHDYSATVHPADMEASAIRQIRRAQITAEIQKLNEGKHTRLSKVLHMVHLISSQ